MNLKSLRKIVIGGAIIGLVWSPFLALAQVTGGPTDVGGVITIVKRVINLIAYLFFLVAAVFIILAAFSYLTAGGDEEKVGGAKKQLTYAIIAILIASLSFAIPLIISQFVGVTAPTAF